MSEAYEAEYIKRAFKKLEHFEEACAALKLDPHKKSDWRKIIKSLGMIGQFGTIRLARRFPFVTDEKTFEMVARTGLEFYWIMNDIIEEASVGYYERQYAKFKAEDDALQDYIQSRVDFFKKREENRLESLKFKP